MEKLKEENKRAEEENKMDGEKDGKKLMGKSGRTKIERTKIERESPPSTERKPIMFFLNEPIMGEND